MSKTVTEEIDTAFIELLGKNAYFRSTSNYTVDEAVSKLVRLSTYLIIQLKQTAVISESNIAKEHVDDVLDNALNILQE